MLMRFAKRKSGRIIILCLLWYITSSTNSIIGKELLTKFPFPMTLTMVQLVSTAFYSGPILYYLGVKSINQGDISWGYYRKIILPLAFGKFTATLFAHIGLWRVPVSYAHTVKATMPLFTIAIARIAFGEKQTFKVYCSLIPIICGVAVATVTEISFDVYGLIASLVSIFAFSLLTVFSKMVLTDTGIHHLRLLHLLGKLALAMFTPFWCFSDVQYLIAGGDWVENRPQSITFSLLFADGFLNWVQNLIAFSLLSLVTPLTYAVANTTKRISVIIVSLLVLGNPVTLTNGFGMLLAIMGVFGYNKCKYDANQTEKLVKRIPLDKVTLVDSRSKAPTKELANHSKSII